jgi:hypothetical protein
MPAGPSTVTTRLRPSADQRAVEPRLPLAGAHLGRLVRDDVSGRRPGLEPQRVLDRRALAGKGLAAGDTAARLDCETDQRGLVATDPCDRLDRLPRCPQRPPAVVLARRRRPEQSEETAGGRALHGGAMSLEDEPRSLARSRDDTSVRLDVGLARGVDAERDDGQREAAGRAGGRRPGRRRERRILREHAPLELAQRGARLQAQRVRELLAEAPIRVEGVGLPPAAVERQHQLLDGPLTERLTPDERLELGDRLGVAPQVEPRIDQVAVGAEPKLVEPSGLVGQAGLVDEVGEGGATPDREGRLEDRLPRRGLLVARVGRQRQEVPEVDRLRRQVEDVARCTGDDGVGAEQPAQPGDVPLKRRRGGRRRLLLPERPDQPLGRDDRPGLQSEHGEHQALLRTAERHRATPSNGLEGAQETDLQLVHAHTRAKRSAVSRSLAARAMLLHVSIGARHDDPRWPEGSDGRRAMRQRAY